MRQSLNGMGILVLALLCSEPSKAQSGILIQLETNAPEGIVYADSTALGPARIGTFVVPANTREIRMLPPGSASWTIEPIRFFLPRDTTRVVSVRLDFPYHYRIESVPFGAEVYLETESGSTRLGVTPLVHRSDQSVAGIFRLRKPGYVSETVNPEPQVWSRYSVLMSPVVSEMVASSEVEWQPPARFRSWIDYSAIGLAVVSGALAVHYKFKADRRYDLYTRSGDASLKDDVKRFDTRAAIGLAGMQVGIGVFALRLVIR